LASSAAQAHPSGEQFELRRDGQRAVVVEVGGGLRTYEVSGEPVVDGYAAGEMCSGGRGQVLVPWPNRVRDGKYAFDGADYQLALSEPEHHNAIHGLVRWANWSVGELEPHRVVMTHRLHPQPGYPFALDLELDYRLEDHGLSVTLGARNAGERPCPFGAGAHPYVRVGTPKIDAATLRAPGRRHLVTDARGIPTGSEAVEGTAYDFTGGRPIGDMQLDTAFDELERGPDGRAVVTMAGPDREVSLWFDEAYRFVMLFTGDTIGEPERRRGGLAIEPMTCAPNAFQTGDGLLTLKPEERFSATWGIAVSSRPRGPS
jgi:aldose 1-epimerase